MSDLVERLRAKHVFGAFEIEAQHEEAADEIERLRKIEGAARYYYEHYCQDEAEEEDLCIDREQHLAALALRDALTQGQSK